jgi:LysR family glycine cleavage system transcriptional activator
MHRLRNLLGSLRVFDALHRAGGVARAADRLHVTPGAVSHQIRLLETALGARLTKKSGREIELTDTGQQLALRLADLFDRVESAVADASEHGQIRRIRLKVIPSFAIKWLMPRLAGFYALHGDIDIEVATVARADDVGLENADFVLRRGDGKWPGAHAELLFTDALVLACSPAMAATLKTPGQVREAKLLHSMIAPASWQMWFDSVGVAAHPQARYVPLANAALCLQAAAQGLGVAVTQAAYLADDFKSGVLVNPMPQHVAKSKLGYYLVCEPGTQDIYPFREFSEWIRAVM